MPSNLELQEVCDTLVLHSARINQELSRLSALIEKAEWSAAGSRLERTCPWCSSRAHDACPMFEGRGLIRRPAIWDLEVRYLEHACTERAQDLAPPAPVSADAQAEAVCSLH